MATARIINPPAELYLDGLYTYNQIAYQSNDFLILRCARLAVLALFASLVAAINLQGPFPPSTHFEDKWKPRFQFPQDNEEWQSFKAFIEVRAAISHYRASTEITQRMYRELDDNIDRFANVTRSLLVRIYGEATLVLWEASITPIDLTPGHSFGEVAKKP